MNGRVWDDTVVIVTSDHGENLGDHNLAEHQFSLHETLLDVPLVIRAPGRLAPGTRNDPVMLTDLFATILDLAGSDFDPSHGLSRSLLSPVGFEQERPVVAEYSGPSAGLLSMLRDLNPELDEGFLAQAYRSVRVGTHRLTISSSGLVTMHDLEDDPGQSHNLADGRPELVNELTLALRRHFPESWGSPGETPEITGETRERLEELGYVASGSRP